MHKSQKLFTKSTGCTEYPREAINQIIRMRVYIIKKEKDWAKKEMENYRSRFSSPWTDLPEIKEISEILSRPETN